MLELAKDLLASHGPIALVSFAIVIGGGYAMRSLWNEIQDLQKRLEEVQTQRATDIERLMTASMEANKEVDKTVDRLTDVVRELGRR